MIGSNLVRRLITEGCDLSVFTRNGIGNSNLASIQEPFEVIQGDITDQESVKAAIETALPNVVFHLACTPFNLPEITSQQHLQVNVSGTLNVLEALRASPATRLIFIGSAAAYGAGSELQESHPMEPATMVGVSKACATMLLQTYARLSGVQTLELRLSGTYGPWDDSVRLIPHVILSALDGRDIPLTSGEQQRDFIHIDDVLEALILGAKSHLPSGTVLNIGSGTGIPIRKVAETILELMGNPVNLLVGAIQMRLDEIMEMSVDITASKESLGWQPNISLTEGLGMSIDWFTRQRELATIGRS